MSSQRRCAPPVLTAVVEQTAASMAEASRRYTVHMTTTAWHEDEARSSSHRMVRYATSS
jgi:hypothetical protein